MKIFLIRHGETTGDIENRYGGSYDDHLTLKGKNQLEKTAQKLFKENKKIGIIFSSPLIRAKESAEIIQHYLRCNIEIIDGLRERHYGVLTELTKREALEKYPEVVKRHKDPNNTDPDGENQQDFSKRIIVSFKSIINKKHNEVAIVSHGGPIKEILSYLGKKVPESIGDGEIIKLIIQK